MYTVSTGVYNVKSVNIIASSNLRMLYSYLFMAHSCSHWLWLLLFILLAFPCHFCGMGILTFLIISFMFLLRTVIAPKELDHADMHQMSLSTSPPDVHSIKGDIYNYLMSFCYKKAILGLYSYHPYSLSNMGINMDIKHINHQQQQKLRLEC